MISFDSFFFNDTATTEIYTLSLHDALPIFSPCTINKASDASGGTFVQPLPTLKESEGWNSSERYTPGRRAFSSSGRDRKSTRLNSSHANISYAVFCLKKKKKQFTRHYLGIQ